MQLSRMGTGWRTVGGGGRRNDRKNKLHLVQCSAAKCSAGASGVHVGAPAGAGRDEGQAVRLGLEAEQASHGSSPAHYWKGWAGIRISSIGIKEKQHVLMDDGRVA